MNTPLTVKSTITIHASAQKVWDALTNPAKTKIYMFGCETVSDWHIGSDLLWKGHHEGQDLIFVKGKILQMEPHRILKYTVIDPFASYPDIPENYLNVAYTLQEEGNQTTLTVVQDGFENAAEGEKRYQETNNNGEGWNPILIAIKNLVESSES